MAQKRNQRTGSGLGPRSAKTLAHHDLNVIYKRWEASFSGSETLIEVSENGGTLALEEGREEAREEVQAPPKRSQDLRQG